MGPLVVTNGLRRRRARTALETTAGRPDRPGRAAAATSLPITAILALALAAGGPRAPGAEPVDIFPSSTPTVYAPTVRADESATAPRERPGTKPRRPVRRVVDATGRRRTSVGSDSGSSSSTTPPPPTPATFPPPPRPKPAQAGGTVRRTATPKPPGAGIAPPPVPTAVDAAKPAVPPPDPKPEVEAKRVRVRLESGKTAIARVYGTSGDRVSVILPDGEIGFTSGLAEAREPFRPSTIDEMERELRAGPYKGFQVLKTEHYLVFYQSTQPFAQASARLLEDLYRKLIEALRKQDVPTHEAEFPLVAVIFRSEEDFRARRKVAPAVQAYYEILSNRIFFYESSRRDQNAPEVAALRRPQTVAHEGTHQILSNIGVQPRLSAWPPWLIEGLAEYCSPPVTVRRGRRETIAWRGLGAVNPFHMATIRDLDDPLAMQVDGPRIGRQPGKPLVEYVVTQEDLSPTDYALSWAVTHYLAQKRTGEFIAFLKTMSRMPPMEERTPKDHLVAFRNAFGPELAKLDRAINLHLQKLKYEPLPYYAVVLEQPIPGNRIRRSAMVSQSPSMIQQWIESSVLPNGGTPRWEIVPHPNRASAKLAAQQWFQGQ